MLFWQGLTVRNTRTFLQNWRLKEQGIRGSRVSPEEVIRKMKRKSISNGLGVAALAVAMTFSGSSVAQKGGESDAQVQANVLRAMAQEPMLANQQITTSTAFGTVTLSGTVPDEATRDLAEKVAAHSEGVKKVVSQLQVGTSASSAPASNNEEDARVSSVTPPPVQDQQPPQEPMTGQANPPDEQMSADAQTNANAQMTAGGDMQQPPQQVQPQQPRRLYRRDYERQLAQQQNQNYNSQNAGDPGGVSVTIPAGTQISVRVDHWLSSGQVQPGSNFAGFIASDVAANGYVAIPRGAAVQGTVLDVTKPGPLSGKGSLTLQLQSVTLAGRVYPLQSDPWTVQGPDKAGRTIGNTAVMGLFGALIGGAIGGGPGALAGAGAGSAAGLGVSAASGGGNAVIPGEAMVNFRLGQPANVVTVSQAEAARLAQNTPPAAPRGPRPAYGGGYYVPGPYPYPYYGPVYPGVPYPGVTVVYGRPYRYGPYWYGYRRW